jgi:hypothetical protein
MPTPEPESTPDPFPDDFIPLKSSNRHTDKPLNYP